MKNSFRSLFALVAATALCVSGQVAHAEKPEPNQSAKILTNILSVTYRDSNIIRAELKQWVEPKRVWLEAKARDIDPIFMITAGERKVYIYMADLTKMGHGDGSGGITHAVNGDGNSCIHQLKAGRFVEGGNYVAGAQSETSPWGKNLTS